MASSIQDNIAAKKQRESGATASTELVLGAGALKLSQATTNLNAAIAAATAAGQGVLTDLNQQASTLTLQIANGEERLSQLAAEATEAKRRNKVEVELDYQADQASAATAWASKANKVILDARVYDQEKEAYDELVDKFEERVQKEVSTATQASAIKHSYELKSKDQEYAAKEADNLAQLKSQAQTILTLQQTIDQLRADATAVRDAEVKRAEAGSIKNLNIGAQPQR